jgi:guanosine-3',5'-bis(diphosphate) 3'-pyrophosphohydrolase
MELLLNAVDLAVRAHNNQKRKYTFDPYIVHPIEVARMVASVTSKEEVIAAAILHDTIEDTEVTFEVIEKVCGRSVAELVNMVSEISKPHDGNRQIRKEIDKEHYAKASPSAKTIKLADIIDNSRSIMKYDSNFARVYMQEKQALLEVLQEGDPRLLARANQLVIDYYLTRLEEKQNKEEENA